MQLPTKLTQRQIIIAGIVVFVVIGVLALFILNLRSGGGSASTATLVVWGTDSEKAFNDMIEKYTGPGSGTNASIKYTQIDPSNYQSDVLSALAAGDAPDIFEIGNHDLPQWRNVLLPMPPTIFAKTFNTATLQTDFPDVVSQDFVSSGYIYALPLSIDTLAMIYNKDLFNTAGIATLPKTWTQFENDVPLLRGVNASGQITQAAAAIGGSQASIPDAPDLVYLLMLQNGTQMNGTGGSSVAFANTSGGTGAAGVDAFNFYLSFANAGSPYYTWADSMGNAENSFAGGKTAIIFGYSSDLATIKSESPFLNYGVAAMPQPDNASDTVNYASYNGLAVNKNSPNWLAAWNFIVSLTTNPADENIYMTDTGSPPALRTSISAAEIGGDPVMSVYAQQALTAQSWYESNSAKIASAVNSAILDVLNGSADSTTALNEAQSEVNGN
jgi:multiple sugar transport system substrate-binding protein